MVAWNQERAPRPLTPILAGVVGLEGEWADGLGAAFKRVIGGMVGDRQLDLGCALNSGAFEQGSPDAPGKLIRYPADIALVAFFVRLVARLQRIGTVPAIDWGEYAAALREPQAPQTDGQG